MIHTTLETIMKYSDASTVSELSLVTSQDLFSENNLSNPSRQSTRLKHTCIILYYWKIYIQLISIV